jgi:hypothetical protein
MVNKKYRSMDYHKNSNKKGQLLQMNSAIKKIVDIKKVQYLINEIFSPNRGFYQSE